MKREQAEELAEQIRREAPELKVSLEQEWVVRVENEYGFWKDLRFPFQWKNLGRHLSAINANWPGSKQEGARTPHAPAPSPKPASPAGYPSRGEGEKRT